MQHIALCGTHLGSFPSKTWSSHKTWKSSNKKTWNPKIFQNFQIIYLKNPFRIINSPMLLIYDTKQSLNFLLTIYWLICRHCSKWYFNITNFCTRIKILLNSYFIFHYADIALFALYICQYLRLSSITQCNKVKSAINWSMKNGFGLVIFTCTRIFTCQFIGYHLKEPNC